MPPWAAKLGTWGPCALALLLMGVAAEHTIDDAYISFHYAERVLEGEGLVFNPGERVEGFTNPSWTLLAVLWGGIGLPHVWAAKLVGAATLCWALIETRRFGQARGLEMGFASWLAALAFPLCAHAVMGLETSAYAALVWGASLRTFRLEDEEPPDARLTGALWALAMWSRPETPLFFAWVVLGMLPRLRLRVFERGPLTVAVGLVAGGLTLLAFRYGYYGEWLPNTYYAKTGGDMLGIPGTGRNYLEAFGQAWWPWAPFAVIGAFWGWREASLKAACLGLLPMVAVWLGYVEKVGGDWMLQWRFMVPIFLPTAFLAGIAFERAWARGGVLRGLAGLSLAGLVVHAGYQVRQGHGDVQAQIQEWDELLGPPVAWLDERGPGSVAVGDIGWIAFHTKRPIVDLIGLIDKDIARSAGGYANKDKVVIAERVFSQKADYLIVMAPRSCYEPGYPALRGLFLRSRDDLWDNYALAEVFSLGADGFNCVFERLGPLSEPIDFERFEGPEQPGWNFEGAMAVQPGAFEDLPDFHHDSRVLTTWQRGQGPGLVGQASSPAFEAQADYLSFRVAGGGGAGLRVELVDADSGDRVREVAGRGDLRMRRVYWDLRPFEGRRLQVRVVDESRGDFGMLFVDDFAFYNAGGGSGE